MGQEGGAAALEVDPLRGELKQPWSCVGRYLAFCRRRYRRPSTCLCWALLVLLAFVRFPANRFVVVALVLPIAVDPRLVIMSKESRAVGMEKEPQLSVAQCSFKTTEVSSISLDRRYCGCAARKGNFTPEISLYSSTRHPQTSTAENGDLGMLSRGVSRSVSRASYPPSMISTSYTPGVL